MPSLRSPLPFSPATSAYDFRTPPVSRPASFANLASLNKEQELSHDSSCLLVPVQDPPVNLEGYEMVLEQASIILPGYEVYAVQEWMTDRKYLVKSAVIFTGDQDAQIMVSVHIPKSTPSTSEANSIWANAVAAVKTPLSTLRSSNWGYLHVSSLASVSEFRLVKLPSPAALTGRPLRNLKLNINLQRMKCTGRNLTLTLNDPSKAAVDAFYTDLQLEPSAEAIYLTHLYKGNRDDENEARHATSGSIQQTTAMVMGLVALIQEALAIFGLGPLIDDQRLTPGDNNTDLYTSSASQVDLKNRIGESHRVKPSGFLDDATTSALSIWEREFGKGPPNYENTLTPTTVAALLSTVMAVRYRLSLLDQAKHHAPPSNPFTHRQKFLASLEPYKSIFSTTPYLDSACIETIKRQYQQNIINEGFSVRRALRSKLPDAMHHQPDIPPEEETNDITLFAEMVAAGWGSRIDGLQTLWFGRPREPRKSRLVGRTRQSTGYNSTAEENTDSDTDHAGFRGLNLIRGIGGRAQHAGAKIRGNMSGLLDASYARGGLFIQEGDPSRTSLPISNDETSLRRQSSVEDQNDTDLQKYRPSRPQLALLTPTSLAPSQRPNLAMRRIATDMGMSVLHEVDDSSADHKDVDLDEAASEDHRARRHSFTTLDTIFTLTRVQHPRDMQYDVELATAYTTLKTKRRQLQELKEALLNAYRTALSDLNPILADRKAKSISLNEQVEELDNRRHAILQQLQTFDSEQASIEWKWENALTEHAWPQSTTRQLTESSNGLGGKGWSHTLQVAQADLAKQENRLIDVIYSVKQYFVGFWAFFKSPPKSKES